MKTVWLWIKTTVYAIFNILNVGCPFIVYPNVWKKLQEPELTPWTIILLLFIMGAFTFNAVFAMKRLLDLDKGKPKADVIDIDVFLKDNDVFEYVAVKRNGKVIKTKSRTEVKEQSYGKKN